MHRRLTVPLAASAILLAGTVTAADASGPTRAPEADPTPGGPAYVVRDTQNVADAYGRIHAKGGQLQNPAYLPALAEASSAKVAAQLLTQAANPTRLAITAGNIVPGWNVGNPLRAGWEHTRGRMQRVAFTNRYGALLRGTVYRPKPGAKDPYTGRRLQAPFPGVVLTEGSVQGSEGMYEWLAQDLAERGYVVLTYDVQGQGASETLPHETGNALPFCNPFATPRDIEQYGCPGVPFQQLSNFTVGTRNALSFFTSAPRHHYKNPRSAGAKVTAYNPYWRLFDRSPDRRTVTPGRSTRIAIIGHSMGAAAVSKLQGLDERVATVVALDKLTGPNSDGPLNGDTNVPVVPALAVQSEYGFTVSPWFLSSGSSLTPEPSPRRTRPDARAGHRLRQLAQGGRGLDARRAAGLDAPRLHRHPPGVAGQPLRPGPHQRLRAALAGPLPQAS
ncbi:MAG: Alpha/beta hydrolase family protein [Nocardioides sp.]|nr:Alpha/beta hydrolase family protein [Nocardioides sp.]